MSVISGHMRLVHLKTGHFGEKKIDVLHGIVSYHQNRCISILKLSGV